MKPRLSDAALEGLPAAASRPDYDRRAITPGIVHLGIGAFHRAHQAVMTEAALAAGARDWGIVAASLRSPDTRDALEPQDGLYTVAVRDATDEHLAVIGAIRRIIVAPEDPEALLAAMSAPATRIVSLTVTEKGYCHDPATGRLNEAHPDIVRDLDRPDRPRSAPGYLVEALARRRAAGVPPFTVLSCDNLPANGAVVHAVLARLAALRDPALGCFVQDEVACPSTMVDRIVPATTDADREAIAARLGAEDRWPVVTEPFAQWVIEDRFPLGRPAWERGGATFVTDVAPFEFMKLRMLNGAHSSLAYLGYLAGHEHVVDAATDPAFAGFLGRLWAEIIPAVPPPEGTDLSAYAAALLARFRNPAIRHRLWQIAMDGSQKLPQRLLGTMRDNLAAGRPIGHLALGVAGWMRYVTGRDERGGAIDVRDPMAAEFRSRLAGVTDAPGIVRALTGIEAVFGRDLPGDRLFAGAVTGALERLMREGARAAVVA
jgi:fructuronate reductase